MNEVLPATSRHPRVGTFRYWFHSDRWEWSDEIAQIHGYRPGEVAPTTELLATHKHPDDRAGFERLVAVMRETHRHFSSRHRIIDTAGATHEVAVIGQTFTDDAGQIVGTDGYYLDLTQLDEVSIRERVNDHVERFRKNTAVIEQAKGMLMLVYGMDEASAFELLRWRSQTENVKLKLVSRAVIAAVRSGFEVPESMRRRFDLAVLAPIPDDD
ncbi:MAG: PAS and ANTAR domain-containing protein [Gordonia sp. (in: high G+C Gram-positive bacteria)]